MWAEGRFNSTKCGEASAKKTPGERQCVSTRARPVERFMDRSEVRSVTAVGRDQPSKPPCPKQATSKPETRYRASIGGSTRSTTFGLAERKHPGAEMIGTSSL